MSNTYLAHALYFPDAAPRREAVMAAHKAEVKSRMDRGVMTLGSALLDAEGNNIGNVLVVVADTLEGAKALIESDAYYTGGVWDPSKLQITRWRLGTTSKTFTTA